MDTFTANDLRRLTSEFPPPCVSVYLPTHPAGAAAQQDALRLKNLLQQAETQLSESWMRGPLAKQLLEAARALPTEPAFWENRSEGLAIFAGDGAFYRYRLPIPFDELLFVNRRFHVKPLLRLLEGDERYLILTLSQKDVRLFRASRHTIDQIQLADLPTNMKDALNNAEAERGSQVHSASHDAPGKQAAVFHGHGGQPDSHKDDFIQFARLIDAALKPCLRDETLPLLLAGVEYLLPLYREVNHYPRVVAQEHTGNCDHLAPHDLLRKTWPLMEPHFCQARKDASQRYRAMAGTGKTCDDVQSAIAAAREGRIATLFAAEDRQVWGVYDADSGEVELHDKRRPGDDDLLDTAVVLTLSQGGTVYAVRADETPSGEAIAAIYRY